MLRRRRQQLGSIHHPGGSFENDKGAPGYNYGRNGSGSRLRTADSGGILTSNQTKTTLFFAGLCFILLQSKGIRHLVGLERRRLDHFRFPPGQLVDDRIETEDLMNVFPLPKHRFRREIRHDDAAIYEEERAAQLEAMDTPGEEQDDKREYRHLMEEEDKSNPCQPLPWIQDTFPSCNVFHEMAQLDRIEVDKTVTQLGEGGTFRIGFLYSYNNANSSDDYVLKALQMDRVVGKEQMRRVNQEALLLDRLSSSDRVSNIYGYCGTSVLVERGQDLAKKIIPFRPGQDDDEMRGYISNEELKALHQQHGGLYRGNGLSPEEKLNIAYDIMSSILLLHDFSEGPVVHNDISFDQWLLSMDNRVILNDFNSAIPLKWNSVEQAFCNHNTRSGNYKSPEFFNRPLSLGQEADVWSLGCILYGILAGVYPYHEFMDDDQEEQYMTSTRNGIPPHLAPQIRRNSFIESILADVMDKMFEADVAKRITINDVVWSLEETRRVHHRRKSQDARRLREGERRSLRETYVHAAAHNP